MNAEERRQNRAWEKLYKKWVKTSQKCLYREEFTDFRRTIATCKFGGQCSAGNCSGEKEPA